MDRSIHVKLLYMFFLAVITAPYLFYDLAFGGGSVKGKVTFEGELPPAEKFVFESFPNSKFCGKHPDVTDEGRRRVINPIEIGKDKGLKHAIVYLQDLQDKQWMKNFEQTQIDIRLCDFLPLTAVVVNGKNIRVVNHDADSDDPKAAKGVAHTVRAYEVLNPRSKPLFSVGLPIKGSELNKPVKMNMWKKGSIIRLTCEQHEWMRGFLLPVQNSFYAVVNHEGAFSIDNIPPGSHILSAWHPKLGKVEQTIEVSEGDSVEINFNFQGK